MKISQRFRAALGVLFDATNWREIQRRPIESVSVRPMPDEVSTDDRLRLVSDSRKLYSNLGPAKGAIDDKAVYSVGRSWLPRFEGEDKAWGDAARKWLLDEWYPVADIAGRDFQTALYLASIAIDRDGDLGVMLTDYEDGMAALQLVGCHAIGTRLPNYAGQPVKLTRGPYSGLEEFDGVVYNEQRRPVAYHLLGPDPTGRQDEWVSARDMALLHDPQWTDQLRGLPGFSHAILDLKDLRTVQGYEKMASALASSIGLIEHNETGLADTSDPAVALSGGVVNASADIVSKEIFGGMIKHFKAGSGAKLEAFKSERPGDAWEKFMNRLIRNAMAGIGWPYELAWDVSALGGANTRYVIAKAMRAVEDRQDLLRPFAKRAVGYAVSKAIKLGKLPPSVDWWRWSFTMPPRMTADFGRDSQAQREDYHSGIVNLSDILAEQGKDLQVHIAERQAENSQLMEAGVANKEYFEHLGAAVRAAAVTPSREVEEAIRKAVSLPPMSAEVLANWAQRKVAQPVTVLPDKEADVGAGTKPNDDEEDDDQRVAASAAANPLAALGVFEVRSDADFVRVPLGARFRDDEGNVRTKTIKL